MVSCHLCCAAGSTGGVNVGISVNVSIISRADVFTHVVDDVVANVFADANGLIRPRDVRRRRRCR